MTDESDDRDQQMVRFVELARTKDRALRDDLVAAHLELAGHVARRFVNRGDPL